MSPLREEIWTALIADLDETNTWPARQPLLAHYTNISTLELIIKNNELWMANPLMMNDSEELRFGMNEGLRSIFDHATLRDSPAGSTADRFVDMYERAHSHFDAGALDNYLTCFCEHDPSDNDGILSMWRGYGANGSGAAIVFDSSKITPDEQSPFIFSKVEYATRSSRQAWIKQKIDFVAEFIGRRSNWSDDELWSIADALLQRLKLFALFSKDKGFREENEWRLVYDPSRDPSKKAEPLFGYFVGARGVEPKLKLKVNGEPGGVLAGGLVLDQIVDRIILGPVGSSQLAQAATRRMFDCMGKPHISRRVVASGTPYRP